MRLINVATLDLEEIFGDDVPKYATLSHTWLPASEEVTFQEWKYRQDIMTKPGYQKIESACAMAQKHGLEYLWVDTNCIDKTSSSELSEAINSMFAWYENSEVCFAYLSDVHVGEERPLETSLAQSRWFTRGWTLQELLAPRSLVFYDRSWNELGSKLQLASTLSRITGIRDSYLRSVDTRFDRATIGEKMSWLSCRTTTRVEDMAYCMLGIFDINMPLLYGEGNKAFTRLQEEIMKVSTDHTLFCWDWDDSGIMEGWDSLFAPSPTAFKDSRRFHAFQTKDYSDRPYALTNAGLRIHLSLIEGLGITFAVLDVLVEGDVACIPISIDPLSAIHGKSQDSSTGRITKASRIGGGPFSLPSDWVSVPKEILISGQRRRIRNRPRNVGFHPQSVMRQLAWSAESTKSTFSAGIFLTFNDMSEVKSLEWDASPGGKLNSWNAFMSIYRIELIPLMTKISNDVHGVACRISYYSGHIVSIFFGCQRSRARLDGTSSLSWSHTILSPLEYKRYCINPGDLQLQDYWALRTEPGLLDPMPKVKVLLGQETQQLQLPGPPSISIRPVHVVYSRKGIPNSPVDPRRRGV